MNREAILNQGTSSTDDGGWDGVLLGILARVDATRREEALEHLERIPGVTTFEVDDPAQLGLLLERATLHDAVETLEETIERQPGVLACWPVFQYDGTSGRGNPIPAGAIR